MNEKPIIEKTVIVLGAGASSDYGFPVGSELIENILKTEGHGFCVLKEESNLSGYYEHLSGSHEHKIFDFKNIEHFLGIVNLNEISKIKENIENSDNGTIKLGQLEFFNNFISGLKLYKHSQIDYFLRTFSRYEKFGKVMIAREILKQEAKARDRIKTDGFRKGDRNKKDEQDWIGKFFASLIEKAKKPEDLKAISDNLTIVTFNYDLLLEHYLNEFCKGDDEWGDALEEFKKNLKIIHIYGKLGRFEWESEENLRKIYGEEVFKTFVLRGNQQHFGCLNPDDYEKTLSLSEGIKVIGGEKHQEDLHHIKQARNAIYHPQCKKIFFFGFGFDKNNLTDCLQASLDKFKDKNVYCTIYNEGDHERIKMSVDKHIKSIGHLVGLEKATEEGNANSLFEYGKFQTAQQISSLLLYI